MNFIVSATRDDVELSWTRQTVADEATAKRITYARNRAEPIASRGGELVRLMVWGYYPAGSVLDPQQPKCAFCYDREQGTHGEIKREYLEDWKAIAPLCRLHSVANERDAHAARHNKSDIDRGERETLPPYDC